MPKPHFLTITEQIAEYLRGEILRGRWTDTIPGLHALADELEVNYKTVDAALNVMEGQGLLVRQGAGKCRKIVLPSGMKAQPSLRVAILDYAPEDLTDLSRVDLIHKLKAAGHHPFFTEKTLTELGMNLSRIQRMLKTVDADAWVVCSGSREVLTWFSEQETPTMAMFGRRRDLPIAAVGPDHVTAGRATVRHLIELGHQRIVILMRNSQPVEEAGRVERAIFDEMREHGFPVGPYNLPEWQDSPEELYRVLDELFRVTPPTALIIHESFIFHAVKDYLAQRGILAPADVSLICGDPNPTFAWCKPSIAHTHHDTRPVVRRIVRWANNIARGKEDIIQTLTPAEFIPGGTVGPAST
jgi:DNA-binding LacI/PurR family transcriptional regulator